MHTWQSSCLLLEVLFIDDLSNELTSHWSNNKNWHIVTIVNFVVLMNLYISQWMIN